MPTNEELIQAKIGQKDEFYTQYEDIEKELVHYTAHFEGKTVLCNCDNPFVSNFCKYFLKNFNRLKLKRLICTCFNQSSVARRQMLMFEEKETNINPGNAYVLDVYSVPNKQELSNEDITNLLNSPELGVKKLEGNGDFRSEECIEYLKQADIVVSNPPFSLFKEYVLQIMQYKKDFLIIGGIHGVKYKNIFPFIKANEIRLGASIHSSDRKFHVPDDYPLRASGCGVDEDGKKYIRVKGVRWFTNLDYENNTKELILNKQYYGNEEYYPKYDNYDAINVDKTAEIPCDYFGSMGVPITFLDKYNPRQFEIITCCSGLLYNKIENGKKISIKAFDRIIIKRRNTKKKVYEENKNDLPPVISFDKSKECDIFSRTFE